MKINMKTIIVVAIILAVSAAAYFLYTTYAGGEDIIVTPNEFGSWEQRVSIEYVDGTITPLTVMHNEKEVAQVNYKLSAKTTASGTGDIAIDLSDYSISFYFEGENNEYIEDITGNSYAIAGDGAYHELISFSVSIDTLADGIADGSYTLTIKPNGSITYKDSEDSSDTCLLPETITEIIRVVTPVETYTLTIGSFDHGTVTLDPAGGTYEYGTEVTITATPESGYAFYEWTEPTSSLQNPLVYTVVSDVTIVPVFQLISSEYEDLSTYTQYDPSNSIDLLGANGLQITDMQNDQLSFLFNEINYGNNEFALEFDYVPQDTGTDCVFGVMFTSQNGDVVPVETDITNLDGCYFVIDSSGGSPVFKIFNGADEVASSLQIVLDDNYHITLSRVIGVFAAYIENEDTSDWERIVIFDGTDIVTFVPYFNYNSGVVLDSSTCIFRNYKFTQL